MILSKIILLLIAGSTLASNNNENDALGIVGGSYASIGDVPYIVAVKLNSIYTQLYGGGVLIKPNIVITSAVACRSTYLDFMVSAATKRFFDTDAPKRNVIKREIHPNFDPETLDNNVCKLTLESDFEMNKNIRTINICKRRPTGSSSCMVAGYGSSKHQGYGFDHLKKLNVSIVDRFLCMYKLRGVGEITRSMICALATKEQGACVKDGGGPLKCIQDGEDCLAGIISWGTKPCAKRDVPFVSTDTTVDHIKYFLTGYSLN